MEEEEGEEQEGEDWKEGAQVAQEEGEGKHDLPSRFCCWTMEPAAYQEVIGGHPSKKEGTSAPVYSQRSTCPGNFCPSLWTISRVKVCIIQTQALMKELTKSFIYSNQEMFLEFSVINIIKILFIYFTS